MFLNFYEEMPSIFVKNTPIFMKKFLLKAFQNKKKKEV